MGVDSALLREMLMTPQIFLLAGLTIAVFTDPYLSFKHKIIMQVIVILAASLVVQNVVEDWLSGEHPNVEVRTAFAMCGYILRPLIILLFCHVVSPERKHTAGWILIGINTAVYLLLVPPTHLVFWISQDNHYQGGPLSRTCIIISFILLAHLVYLTVVENRRTRKWALCLPVAIIVAIIVSIYQDYEIGGEQQPVAFLTMAIVGGSVFYYIWLHMQFVWKHEDAMHAQQRIQIMMSQIQPHFMYNTLATVQALCYTDPEKAAGTVEKFARYLRQNLDSLSETNLVPFRKELEHTQIYADIEMVMYPTVHVEWDIGEDDFQLPALTVQPLVENAIRYGARARSEGYVLITTRREDGGVTISISDNGKGFDPSTAVADSTRSHIGLKNVRERLEKMCDGGLEINSVIGEGTTVTIWIPDPPPEAEKNPRRKNLPAESRSDG